MGLAGIRSQSTSIFTNELKENIKSLQTQKEIKKKIADGPKIDQGGK